MMIRQTKSYRAVTTYSACVTFCGRQRRVKVDAFKDGTIQATSVHSYVRRGFESVEEAKDWLAEEVAPASAEPVRARDWVMVQPGQSAAIAELQGAHAWVGQVAEASADDHVISVRFPGIGTFQLHAGEVSVIARVDLP